ncbi:MAG: hypothetical protein KGL39_52540, partial [Patescibacteria group bacterium]|nr:hypothetical protein [Patescibacteria group bacterium]
FDPESYGTRFSTIATYWIRQAMQCGTSADGLIRIPYGVDCRLAKASRVGLESLAISERQAGAVKAAARARHIYQEGDGASDDRPELRLCNLAIAKPEVDQVEAAEEREKAERLMDVLTPQERQVIRSRFGFNATGREQLRTIADRYGLCRERIRQIEETALKKMREAAGLQKATA